MNSSFGKKSYVKPKMLILTESVKNGNWSEDSITESSLDNN